MVDDAKRALDIYGPVLSAIKGKMTRRCPKTDHMKPLLPIPLDVLNAHSHVDVSLDIMKVQGILFLVLLQANHQFCTTEGHRNKVNLRANYRRHQEDSQDVPSKGARIKLKLYTKVLLDQV